MRATIHRLSRACRILGLALLTIATMANLIGWWLSLTGHSWTLNPSGYSPSTYSTGLETWRIIGTIGNGWFCAAYRGHSTPRSPRNWKCDGPGAEPWEGTTRGVGCPHEYRSGWPYPLPGRWYYLVQSELETAEWTVCSMQGDKVIEYDVKDHSQWLKARAQPNVWLSPLKVKSHWDVWLAAPFWFLTLLTGFLPAVAATRWWIRKRRNRRNPNECKECGYDLTGNVTGRCPECGTMVNLGRAAPVSSVDELQP